MTSTDYVVEAFVLTDIGCYRTINQDALAYVSSGDTAERERRGVLAIVADGMGGHQAGEVASRLAVDVIRAEYFRSRGPDPLAALRQAFLAANVAIFQAASEDASLFGMGTTATALALRGPDVLVAHVGDSRLYRLSEGGLRQLTQDDTLVAAMLRDGLIGADQMRSHPDRNVLMRALGTHTELGFAAQRCEPPRIGESFVLCSDGLHDVVEDGEIDEIVRGQAPEAACRRLVDLAKLRESGDNISAAVVSIRPAYGSARAAPVTRDVFAKS